jgi:outer membrane protein OmpA-like peptidoglycan-associated protein
VTARRRTPGTRAWSLAALLAASLLVLPRPASACQQLPIVYFRGGSSAIGPDGEAALRGFAQQALARLDRLASIRIVGHSDRTGAAAARARIARERAQAVRNLLIGAGIPARLIGASGAADAEPAADTPEGVREPLNRRAELRIAYAEGRAPAAEPGSLCR